MVGILDFEDGTYSVCVWRDDWGWCLITAPQNFHETIKCLGRL